MGVWIIWKMEGGIMMFICLFLRVLDDIRAIFQTVYGHSDRSSSASILSKENAAAFLRAHS